MDLTAQCIEVACVGPCTSEGSSWDGRVMYQQTVRIVSYTTECNTSQSPLRCLDLVYCLFLLDVWTLYALGDDYPVC